LIDFFNSNALCTAFLRAIRMATPPSPTWHLTATAIFTEQLA
jgi:hypothetical protein